MARNERIELMVEALRESAKGNRDFVHFVDMGQQENWVRVWNFGRGDTVRLEVTNRAIPGSPLPALTAKQIDSLVALGVGPAARPNFTGVISGADAAQVAERVERIFEALRSKPDFELAAGLGSGTWSEPDPNVVDVYAGIRHAPDPEAGAGDLALLERIKNVQSRYRMADGRVTTVEPPYVVTCLNFDEGYCYFADEEAIMLRSISLAMQAGDLTGEQAREAYRPYREWHPEIYEPDYQDWNDWGFPVSTDDMDELAECSIAREADTAGIEGAGVPWGDLSPMSGIPLAVESDEAMEQLRNHFRGRYAIVCTGTDGWWDLPPDEAQRLIEQARAGANTGK
jgi:hypothetical protein